MNCQYWYLVVAALLHVAFMIFELFPWPCPLLLTTVVGKLKPEQQFRQDQPDLQKLVATIVHNAGIYNGIVAGGLLWAACFGASLDVARVMLIGAVAAGVFGAVTMKNAIPAIQAIVGIASLILLRGHP
jgi:uncharacterized membrane protein